MQELHLVSTWPILYFSLLPPFSFFLSFFISLSLPFSPSLFYSSHNRRRWYFRAQNVGVAALRTAPVYDVIFVSFRRTNTRPACLFNVATVSSRLSLSLFYHRHPLSSRLPHSVPRRASSAVVCLTCLFYLFSLLMPLSHMRTCSQRNNSLVHFLVYL